MPNTRTGAIFYIDVPFMSVHGVQPTPFVEVIVEQSSTPTAPAGMQPTAGLSSSSGKDSSSPSSAESSSRLAAVSVLLVEDDGFMLEIGERLLTHGGVGHVASAADGEEALERLTCDTEKFDVALVDLQMPVMDGLECVRRLREWELKQSTRQRMLVIAVSANADDDEVVAQCRSVGFDHVHAKPLTAGWVATQLPAYVTAVRDA
jgi:CheY-like chemotaxis protein